MPVPPTPSIGWGRVALSSFLTLQDSPFLARVAAAGVLLTGCPSDTTWSWKACWAQGAQVALRWLL